MNRDSNLKSNTSNKQNITYCNFTEFINNNLEHIQIIKQSYLELLENLTTVENIPTSLFVNNINQITNSSGLITIAYIGNISNISNISNNNFKIVGSGTVLIEPKLIHGGKSVGHIEDIVVDKNFRGLYIGQTILSILKSYSKEKNCYKVILDCDKNLQFFYEKNDFKFKSIQMAKYF